MVSLKGKKGIALIMAMWIMTILVMVAASFAFMMRTEIKMATNSRNNMQAHYLARAGVEKAIALLRNDVGTTDHFGEAWYTGTTGAGAITLGRGNYTVTVEDEAGKINLNTPLFNWNHLTLPGIAEVRAGNIITYRSTKAFDTIREIVKVELIGETIFDAQQGNITVYSYDSNTQAGGGARININTASAAELDAALTLSAGDADQIRYYVDTDPGTPFTSEYWIYELNTVPAESGSGTILTELRIEQNADKIKVTDDATLTGAININTASADVLSAFGFTPTDVSNIMATVPYAERGEIIPVTGITPADFNETDEPVCDLLTVKSNCFRIISIGEVKDASGSTIAQRKIEAVVNKNTPVDILYWSETVFAD